jgi:hypothetical protein
MEGIVAEYGSENISPPVLNMEKWEKDKEEYIELSFTEWGWHTNQEHDAYMKTLEENIESDSTAAEEKERLKVYARALRLERASSGNIFRMSSSLPRRQWFTLSNTRGSQTDS